MTKPKHRNAPGKTDPEYQRIIQAFNLDPGNPLPRIKKQGKPFVVKRRGHRRARR